MSDVRAATWSRSEALLNPDSYARARKLVADMASSDVTTVRRLFEAHERGDGAAFLRLCHPEVEYRGRTSDTRVFRGRDGMSEWLRQLRAADVEIDAVPQDYEDRGDHVVVVGRLRIWDAGALKDQEATWCFEVEEGLVTKIVPVDETRNAA